VKCRLSVKTPRQKKNSLIKKKNTLHTKHMNIKITEIEKKNCHYNYVK